MAVGFSDSLQHNNRGVGSMGPVAVQAGRYKPFHFALDYVVWPGCPLWLDSVPLGVADIQNTFERFGNESKLICSVSLELERSRLTRG